MPHSISETSPPPIRGVRVGANRIGEEHDAAPAALLASASPAVNLATVSDESPGSDDSRLPLAATFNGSPPHSSPPIIEDFDAASTSAVTSGKSAGTPPPPQNGTPSSSASSSEKSAKKNEGDAPYRARKRGNEEDKTGHLPPPKRHSQVHLPQTPPYPTMGNRGGGQERDKIVGGNMSYLPPPNRYNQMLPPGQQSAPYPPTGIHRSQRAVHHGMASSHPRKMPGAFVPQTPMHYAGQGAPPMRNSQTSAYDTRGVPGAPPYVADGQEQYHQDCYAHHYADHYAPDHFAPVPFAGQGVPPMQNPQASTYYDMRGMPRASPYVAAGRQDQRQDHSAMRLPHAGLQQPINHGNAASGKLLSPSEIRASIGYTLNASGNQMDMHAPNRGPFPPPIRVCVALPADQDRLSQYQCMARKHMEFFSATHEDVGSYMRGRNKQILIGQVGIRCVHCKKISVQDRGKASVYFPGRLLFLYQAAQNLATMHLCESCPCMPPHTKKALQDLHNNKTTAGGGKVYWAEAGAALGLIDTDHGVRFRVHAAHPATRRA